MISLESQKLDFLRKKQALLNHQIAEIEGFITVLKNRASENGDALDRFLESQLAAMATTVERPNSEIPAESDFQTSRTEAHKFPKLRSDSIWPYLVRHMTSKETWTVDELFRFAKQNKLVTTQSGLRSTMSSLKTWGFVESNTPGVFALKPRGIAYVNTLTPNQFFLKDESAGTTHDENDV